MENRTINIGVVKKVAIALKHIRPKVAFVGGAIISLYADDPAADEVRPTKDIDLSLTLESYGAWAKLQEELATLGFQPDKSKLIMMSKERGAPSSGKYKVKNEVIEINSNYAFRIVQLSKDTLTLHLILNFENSDVSIKGEALEMKFIQMKKIN